jgi:hypothetical protein
VDYARTELAANIAQLPDADALEWRSEAQRRFRTRVDELRRSMRDALTTLELTADALDVAARAAALAATSAGTASGTTASRGGRGFRDG